MKYRVTGADSETGDAMEMIIEAANEAAAQGIANRKGIMVSRVVPMVTQQAQSEASAYAQQAAQPLEQGHLRGSPVVNVAPPRRGSSLGVSSLILGIIAFVICWIPLVNLLGVPLSALGLLLGLLGLLVAITRKGASIGFPIAGSAICALALFIAISTTDALVGGLKKAGDEMAKESERRNATNQTTTTAAPVTRTPSQTTDQNDSVSPPPETATPTVPTEAPLSEASKPEVEWASAETPVRQGDVQVQVKAVKVGQVATVEKFGDGTGTSEDSLVSIELEITNLSETRKINYQTWGGEAFSVGEGSKLTDNFDNRYKIVHFGFGSKVVGSVESESVYPGKAIKDVIVFEEPVAKAEFLNLELPAKQFGGTGVLRFRIPASMIQR